MSVNWIPVRSWWQTDRRFAPSGRTAVRNRLCVCLNTCILHCPDSVINGCTVHDARIRAGKLLWKEHPVDADVVIGVPDSGLDAALGLSQAAHIPYEVGFIKNRYVGRTFIQPNQKMRTDSVRIKLNVVKSVVAGKRVILVDDSIVRGTTCQRIVNLLREAGATEVHMRISCPPFTNPCHFGVDIDSKENLIACQMTIPEICSHTEQIRWVSERRRRAVSGNAGNEAAVRILYGVL